MSSSSRVAPLLMLASIASAPSSAWAQAAPTSIPAPPPPQSKAKGFVWGGATLFVLPYLASAIAATTGYENDAATSSARGVLWVPAVGPFIMMGNTSSGAADVLLVLDGLAQLGGLTMFVYGLASPKTDVVGDDPGNALRIAITPLVSRGASGATFVATF